MLSVRRIVGGRLKENLGESMNVTFSRNSSPSKFPTLNIDSLGEPSMADDLEHKWQNAIISTIELKTYCIGDGKITEARNFMDEAGDVMLSMGYSLIYGPEDISSEDKGIMVARFRRTFGARDVENLKKKI